MVACAHRGPLGQLGIRSGEGDVVSGATPGEKGVQAMRSMGSEARSGTGENWTGAVVTGTTGPIGVDNVGISITGGKGI